MVEARYQAQMGLLLRVLPHVFRENVFALKGGTAINLFFRGLPRLSVDVDLAYLPIESREDTLQNIGQSLDRIAQRLKAYLPMVNRVTQKKDQGYSATLLVEGGGALVKIEPNRVIRGSAFPCEDREMHHLAAEIFGEGAYANLTNDERKFILSFKEGLPHWDWLGVVGAEKLPAPAWKLANIRKMDAKKHREAYQDLKRILER